MIVDAWIQHPTPAFLGHDMFASLRRWTGDEIPERFPIDLTLGAMDAAGVDVAIVSAWHGPEGVLISNDEVAEVVRAAPGRFAGAAAVDLRDPVGAVRELRRCVEDLGFVALRAIPWLWGWPPNDRRYYPLYVACVELGIPFCTQVGHTGPLRTSETGRPIPYIDDIALDVPELTIVGGHIGYPWTDEMLALARKHENVWIDTSAYTAKRYPAALVDELGRTRHKVLFGSNFPMITPERCLEDLGALDLGDAQRERFLSGNATSVFRLPGAVSG